MISLVTNILSISLVKDILFNNGVGHVTVIKIIVYKWWKSVFAKFNEGTHELNLLFFSFLLIWEFLSTLVHLLLVLKDQ